MILSQWDCMKKCRGKAIVKAGNVNRKVDNHTFIADVPDFTPWEVMDLSQKKRVPRPIVKYELLTMIEEFYSETEAVIAIAKEKPMHWFVANRKYRFRFLGGVDQ